ncbi:MAG: oxidoreductase, partial [Armatimonadetes bacterium]|nr:oxidoreductase [Armatimonadota bacterium]
PGRGPFHLGRLVVGSEGTLALVLEATLRVVPLPQARILALVHFDSLLEALEATPLLLQQGPSAVELVDRFILDTTRNSPRFQALRQEFIQGDPAALLMVEWSGGSAAALADCTEAAEEALRRAGLGWFFLRVSEPAAQSRAWSLRRGALGLSMSERGDAKAISFVEDTAVDPARLRDYIERFLALLEEQSTTAGFYAHASVGLLHVRPVVNLKTEAGVTQFQRIAAAVADLVLEFGGALSGEHGDGLVRSPFQERMFGPVLYQAFREIKRTFDPYGLFNPGKIVDAPPLTENLRFGPNTITRDPLTVLDFEEFGGIARAAEQCAGIGECRKRRSGTMCPSFMATRDERDSTRGRANALRQALAGELGGEGLASRELQQALELCLECKACKIECPTGVDMARLKAEVLHHQRRAHGLTLRDFLLSRPHVLAAFGSANPRLANQLLASRLGRFAAHRLGLAADRRFPQLAETPFTAPHSSDPGRARETGRWGVLFVDTFTHYFEPEVAQAAWELMQAEGTEVVVLQGPC